MRPKSAIVTIQNFHARKLNNERRIFVYLPPGYAERENQHYPVLYMHAGQRAFDPAQPGTESWNIHKAADRLIGEGKMDPIIIVAIAHVRPVKANEFYHFVGPKEEMESLGCSGLDYEDFIINDLKPYIDSRFRTFPEREHTAMIGASAGALSTYNIGFRNPDVFGKLILLSPYFVRARLAPGEEYRLIEEKLIQPYEGRPPLKIWMDIGDAEGLFLPRHVREVVDRLLDSGFRYMDDAAYLLEPEAAHQEADWGARVHLPLLFMFGRLGEAVSLSLLGRDVVGLQGMTVQLNPIVRFESGFAVTELDGSYRAEDPSILEVRGDGTIVAKKTGTTTVTLTSRGLHASKTITVVEKLSEHVEIRMHAEVPDSTPTDAELYGGMGMKLAPAGTGRFEGRFLVPRDSGYRFRFTRGFRKFETDAAGNVLPNRSFRASEDLDLFYKVEQWEGLREEESERRTHASTGL